jgi:tetratricopeptide (TPR) repeat protein
MMESLALKIKVEFKDYFNFQLGILKKRFLTKFIVFGIIVLIPSIVLLCFSSDSRVNDVAFASFMPVIIYMILLPSILIGGVYYTSKKGYESDIFLQNEQEYTFNQEGFQFSDKNSTTKMKWEEVYKYEEAKSNLLIYIALHKSFVIPKRLLTDAEADTLKTLFKNNVVSKEKKKFFKPKMAFYGIYFIIAGILIWSNYNSNVSDHGVKNFEKGYAKEHKNDYEGAIIDFTNAIKDNAYHSKAYNHRGFCKGMLGNFTGELEDCSKAIDLDKLYGNAYYNRGEAKHELYDSIGACNDYQKAFDAGYKDAQDAIDEYCR